MPTSEKPRTDRAAAGRASFHRGHPAPLAAVVSDNNQQSWQYRAGKGFLAHPGWEGDLAVSCCELHVCVHRAADPGWLGVRGWGEREGDVHSHTWLTAITAALAGSPRPQIHAHCQIFSKNTSLEVLFSFLNSEFLRKAIKAPTSTKMYFVLKVESTTPKLGSPKAVLCVSTIKGFIRGGFHIQQVLVIL